MFKKMIICAAATLALTATVSNAQSVSEFKPACDSLTTLMKQKTTVNSPLSLERVMRRGDVIDLYFGQNLSDYPWRKEDLAWLKSTMKTLIPEKYSKYAIGNIYCKGTKLESLIMPSLGNDGHPTGDILRTTDPKVGALPFVERVGETKFDKGMSGRYIALWQSHGRYFEESTNKWEWQRANLFQTVEDMYTQSYVLPYLMPMLENAGAYCLTPRERDTQKWEVVADNDPSFKDARTGYTRKAGSYKESGSWKSAGEGFADAKMIYTGTDNPFHMGTVRMTDAVSQKDAKKKATITWSLPAPERGNYAVYISYKTMSNSTKSAHYTVKHMGGDTEFIVDQTRGGSTWIYLGTFEFDKNCGEIVLDNVTPASRKHENNTVVTADAVKIGGGMGKVARGIESTPVDQWKTSGVPSFVEGAIYWMQWAGVDEELLNSYDTDYTKDYADRGKWVKMMAGGSKVNPKEEGKGIPFDLSFAFHTDAGTFPDDSIVGTLSIYTLLEDGLKKYPNGEDRMLGRELADQVQSQMVQDARSGYDPKWTRRQLWDRSYSESRTTGVPGMLLEFLSHQNFADMKYGLDPKFQFDMSRAVYKGFLKFLSNRYGCDYVVQPLPVNSFAATMPNGSEVKLMWKATKDTLELTADPKSYILYTRVDGEGWDQGEAITTNSMGNGFVGTTKTIEKGHIYSYKVVAVNEGGKSFPSEILSVGIPESSKGLVAVVNNFDRVAPPAWLDSPTVGGFMSDIDRGVGDNFRINYIGDQYNFRRELPWLDDDNPGFGACWQDFAGELIPGNTFDYPYVHGKAIMAAGYGFYSVSNDAFAADNSIVSNTKIMDIICGKQIATMVGRGVMPVRHRVFPTDIQNAIKAYTANGGSILISGAHIGTDVWDEIYPIKETDAQRADTKKFVEETLGYRWMTNHATRTGTSEVVWNNVFMPDAKSISFQRDDSDTLYRVETADGIVPSGKDSKEFLRYSDTNITAGVEFQGKGYKVISIGFPIEVITDEATLNTFVKSAIEHLK